MNKTFGGQTFGGQQVQLDENGNRQALSDRISRQIAESLHGRITFAQYMDLVLYEPQHGYYAAAPTKIGAIGDFFTSPHLGADFGEMLAEQFVQMWHILGQPDRFTLVEMGAGQGLLAHDILSHLQRQHPRLFARLEYIIIERAAVLLKEQGQRLRSLLDQVNIRWQNLEDLSPNSITGCFFSNELVDAFPVHWVTVRSGQLQEVYITLANDRSNANSIFVEVTDQLSTPQLAHYFDRVGIDLTSPRYPDGYRTEVNLAALDWMACVAERLQRGYVLTIDYGYPSDRYYNPVRTGGTLQCYYRHRYHDDPYQYIGQQDITAHVDFTALQQQGERCGLQTIGFTRQGLFLMALGLGERLAAVGRSDSRDVSEVGAAIRRREALHTLIDPMRLGNFGVLIQGKGVKLEELIGLRGKM